MQLTLSSEKMLKQANNLKKIYLVSKVVQGEELTPYEEICLQQQQEKRKRPMFTYALQCTVTKMIKIGKSSRPHQRIKQIQNISPTPIEIVLIIEGDREKEMHKAFDYCRDHGEWFRLTPDLASSLGL